MDTLGSLVGDDTLANLKIGFAIAVSEASHRSLGRAKVKFAFTANVQPALVIQHRLVILVASVNELLRRQNFLVIAQLHAPYASVKLSAIVAESIFDIPQTPCDALDAAVSAVGVGRASLAIFEYAKF